MIHPTAEIESDVFFEDIESVSIWHYCHVRSGAFIGRGVSLGRNCYIDGGANVGPGCRLQNNVNVYDGVYLTADIFVGPNSTFTNDLHPRAFSGDNWSLAPTYVHKGASFGAGCVIVCGVIVGKYAMCGAGTVVCRDIDDYELVIGKSEHVRYIDNEGTC